MDHMQKMIVAASIEKLVAKDEGSAEHARTIINAFKDLKLSSPFQVTGKSKKQDKSTESLTEHGNFSFDQGEESKIREYGVHKERVGKWVIIREAGSSEKNYMLTIHHFLHQGLGSEVHKEYFLEYEEDLTPTAFGYIGDPEKWFSFWRLSIYFRAPVIIFGESRRKKRLCFTISNQD